MTSQTVVLLHSSASSSRQWKGLIDALPADFGARAVDLYGHGDRAGWPGKGPLTLADEAELVAPLLQEVGGAHLVGHSYGAAIALKLAIMHPTLVKSVVAYEPVLFRWLIQDDTPDMPVHAVVAVTNAIRKRLAMNQSHSAAQRFIDFWSGAGSWQSLRASRQDDFAACMRAVLHHFDALFREPLHQAHLAWLRMPVFHMSGARTVAATRRIGELLRYALPDALHERLPGMGHMGPITHAAEVNRRIVRFLQSG